MTVFLGRVRVEFLSLICFNALIERDGPCCQSSWAVRHAGNMQIKVAEAVIVASKLITLHQCVGITLSLN